MRILITGISGFLGRRLAVSLLEAGHSVAGLDLGLQIGIEDVVTESVDILDRSALTAAVARLEPDCVVHLAGLSHVGQSWKRMPEYFDVNVIGAENALAAADGRKFILASSSEVYGAVPENEQPIAEDRRPAPRNPYGLTKAAAERLVLAGGGVVTRMFNLAGPGQSQLFALPSFAGQLAAQAGAVSPILLVGNLEARRDFVHVADAAEAFLKLVERGVEGEIYNLACGEAVSIEEALNELIRVAGIQVSVRVDPERLRPVDVPLVTGDATKLGELGWRARRGWKGALADLWEATLESVAGASG